MAARRPRPQHAVGYRALCTLLRDMREQAGLTQRALGQKLRVHGTIVHRSETGDRRIDPVELARWARACGVDPVDAMARLVESARIR
ncbi:MAG: helix-turn-helix transcriptional regulator [Planctomycetes bacterium]|nr:helix-turn-helix transcriptional regulator [Planctomycetota bacterium]